jgi:hypothetical protein
MAKKELSTLPDFTALGDGDKVFGKNAAGNLFGFFPASIFNNKGYACRRWNESLSTPTGEVYGNIDYLRELPSLLGLGCYLVADNRERRKLSVSNHYNFVDGSVAALDGSMGQYMWCWNEHYYANWQEGGYFYEAVSLNPIPGKTSYKIPEGGISALGAGVLDRDNLLLCSAINNSSKYRGGNNDASLDGTYKTQLGKVATNISTHNFGVYARKRGEGWEANWYIARAVPEYLFRIIFGTRNIQAAVNANKDANGLYQGGLGAGVTAMSSWSAYNGTYPIIPTSAGVELADGCGEATYNVQNADGATVYAAKIPVFFGLKHLFGHIWTGVRGLVVNVGDVASEVFVAPSMYSDYNDASVAGLLKATECPRSSGYISKISMHKLCAMPTAVGGSASTYYCDNFWESSASSKGLRVRRAGASADNGTDAGAGATYTHYAASSASPSVSSPLCYFREDPVMS